MLGWLGDLLGLNQGDPAIKAAGLNKGVLGDYKAEANGIIDKGAATAGGLLDKAGGLYSTGSYGDSILTDALGLNGAAGAGKATEAFQAGPGYDFQMDQGLQALDRNASARGSFASGGAMTDTLKFSQGLADNSWNSWLDRITGQVGKGANVLGDKANLAVNTAGQHLGVAGDYTSGLLGANNQVAEGEGKNKGGLSNLFGKAVGMFTGYGGF